ncbi:hypothetical protein C8Q73DRAFT_695533 [Cubamyces lactineus]|nr:hypothetical protein C8Q73DRAFT_695533 [Cubamyces lactineus]
MLPRLERMRGYETRIHAESDCAFVYQPFILEGPGATYFVEWSTPDRPERLAKWTRGLGDLHLFVWPYKPNGGWYYVGLHSLVYAEMESRWPILDRSNKRQLLDNLRSRNPDMNPVQFRNDIREGRKVQVCLRLESKGLMESEDFAKESGLLFEE